MKQTAMMEHIKWLYEVIDIAKAQQMNADIIQAIEYVLEGAKAKLAMEKEQHSDTWKDGMKSDYGHFGTFEQYYNHNFES
jgi:hypothetical protein